MTSHTSPSARGAVRARPFGGRLDLLARARRAGHVRADLGKGQRIAGADAAARAGDDGDLVVQWKRSDRLMLDPMLRNAG